MTLAWLMDNAGPVIRWRIANELMPETTEYIRHTLVKELVDNSLVQSWVNRLSLGDFPTSLDSLNVNTLHILGNMVHGSKAACLENVLGKLAEFGLQANMPNLDKRALPLMRIFSWNADWKTDATFQIAWEKLVKSVFAWGLLRMGYTPDTAMQDFLLSHLEICHKIARDQVYDIYAGETELVGLPKAWKGKPIIKQDVMANYWLPYIHDLYLFANFPSNLKNENTNRMIEDLVAYILDPRFQALQEGYGYAWIKERHTCYGWGWSPHLKDDATRVQRIELMAHFSKARQSPWFQESLRFMESYLTPEGRYLFPGKYLRESEGYYVSGSGMGLGENRRKIIGTEIESTFRMCLIKKMSDSK